MKKLRLTAKNSWVKISTSNEGLIKVIDGTSKAYKTDDKEKAHLIFRRDDND